MPQFTPFLGDKFYSVQATVEAMLRTIGRDTSDLDFTQGTVSTISLPDDPDVRIAWDALQEVHSEVFGKAWTFNTIQLEIDPDDPPQGAAGSYNLPLPTQALQSALSDNTTEGIASVRILRQPPGLQLIYEDTASNLTPPPLRDMLTDATTGFEGKGAALVEVSYYLAWPTIPSVARRFMFIRGVRKFQARAVAETIVERFSQEEETRAWIALNAFDHQVSPVNFFDSKPEINDRWPY
jgi:Tail tubular protein